MKYPDITTTALFAEAVRQARIDSRRYWAKGGPADKEYPCLKTVWRIKEVNPEKRTEEAVKRHRGSR
jgi:hypothetical protein